MFRLFLTVTLLALLALPGVASARPVASGPGVVERIDYPGMQKLRYRYGPVLVRPGQNSISVAATDLHPKVPGFVTRFEPNMVRASDGTVPPANLLHMHHVAWLLDSFPTFLGVEEKTIVQYPRGFGLYLEGNEFWRVNNMIHNWISRPERVYLTWEIDFVPRSAPAAKRLKPLSTQWMDVAGVQNYPVFDALRGAGKRGRFVFPDDARGKNRQSIGFARRWRVERPTTLVHAISHLHPGGLFNDLWVTRNGERRRLFRSEARYYQAAGPVSWNASISASRPDWRVKLRPGDLVELKTTYDTSSASWYEAMGIMPLAIYDGHDVGGVDAFEAPRDIWKRDMLTHGELPENRLSGGSLRALPDTRALPDGPTPRGPVAIRGFRYGLGDLSAPRALARPPVIRPGQRLSFVNLDATRSTSRANSIYHTVTACKAPCTETSGLAFPLADGRGDFDSGQLGFGLGVEEKPQPPSANRNNWSTPASLSPGTYTFFCRIHPEMRGAFRVKPASSLGSLNTGWSVLPASEVFRG